MYHLLLLSYVLGLDLQFCCGEPVQSPMIKVNKTTLAVRGLVLGAAGYNVPSKGYDEHGSLYTWIIGHDDPKEQQCH